MANARTLVALLLEERLRLRRNNPEFWPWLPKYKDRRLPRKIANRYVLYSFLDYQMKGGTAIRNTNRFVDEILGNPDDLWGAIAEISIRQWEARFSEYGLHRFRQAHRRVRQAAGVMVSAFCGDARQIWHSGDPSETRASIEKQLGMGPQLARMCVLGLLECGIIKGDGDVKADLHVRRVAGRLLRGRGYAVSEAGQVHTELRKIKPSHPWKLDLPLFEIGRRFCFEHKPDCENCPVESVCKYARNQ